MPKLRCPYNSKHSVSENQFIRHLSQCRKQLTKEQASKFGTCKYNSLHIMHINILEKHIQKCQDRQIMKKLEIQLDNIVNGQLSQQPIIESRLIISPHKKTTGQIVQQHKDKDSQQSSTICQSITQHPAQKITSLPTTETLLQQCQECQKLLNQSIISNSKLSQQKQRSQFIQQIHTNKKLKKLLKIYDKMHL